MKKFLPFLMIPAVPVILLLLSNSTGSPGGKSGSIGDNGNTCVQCHTPGPVNTVTGWITTNVPPEGYTPGQTYLITATGTHTGVVKFGFELTVENSQGNKVGTLQLTEPTRTKFTNSNHAVTHTAAGNVPSGNTNTWTMNWVAPSNVSGNIGIYAAFNAANGNGNNQGDVIYKSSIFISKYVPPPTLVSIVPNSGNQGTFVSTTITGQNTSFSNPAPVVYLSLHSNPAESFSASNVVVVNSTTLQADFNIPYESTPGLWDLHVGDLELTNAFEVIAVIPFLVSIVPDNGDQGSVVTTTITATDSRFTLSEPVVYLNYSENPNETIEMVSVNVISDEVIEAEFLIPAGASAGLWDVHVDDMVLESGFTVNIVIGLEENSANLLTVYPNPASDKIFIENAPGTEIEIFRTSGELVKSVKITENRQMIDVSPLSKGMYIIRIHGNGSVKVEKFLVN